MNNLSILIVEIKQLPPNKVGNCFLFGLYIKTYYLICKEEFTEYVFI